MRQPIVQFFLATCFFVSATLFAQDASTSSNSLANVNEPFAALADIIENPTQRAKLIATLRILSEEDTANEQETNDTSGLSDTLKLGATTDKNNNKDASNSDNNKSESVKDEEEDTIKTVAEGTKAAVVSAVTLPGKLAAQTNDIAVEVGESLLNTWESIVDIAEGKDYRLRYLDKEAFLQALTNLLLIVATVIALFQGARYLSRAIKKRLNHWVLKSTSYKPIVRNLIGTFVVVAMDLIFLGITYLIANSVALYGIGEAGKLSVQTALFLNAFLIIETIKIALRLVFYHRYSGLRLLPSKNTTARYWYKWLANMVNIIGYGYMVAVPLVNINMSNSLGKTVSSILAIAAFIYGVTVVWRNRRDVCKALQQMAEHNKTLFIGAFLRILSHLWHWLAIAYFIMLLVVTILQAERALPFVMRGTMLTIISIGVGVILSTLLSQLIGHRIVISSDLRRKLPYLESRLNAYIPAFLRIIRFVLTVAVVLIVLSAWNFIDLNAWVHSEKGAAFLSRWIGVFMIMVFAFLLWLLVSSVIEHRLSAETGSGRPTARAQTLLSLFKNALTISIAAVTVMMVLSEIGINIGPLIAGAGVLGLAIGFGAQTLVQDVITGIFIQIENAMNSGDLVTLGNITGTVEHISIRSVGLRDLSGTYHLIPFSSVTTVSNFNRGYAYHVGEYGIAYREDIDEAFEIIKQAFKELSEGEHKRAILEPISVDGVTKLDNSSVNIRVSIKTIAGQQFAVGRAFNRLVKIYFDRAGIEMPFPHLTMYFGQGKEGEAAPANLRLMREAFDIEGNPQQIKEVANTSMSDATTKVDGAETDKDTGDNKLDIGDTSEIRVAPRQKSLLKKSTRVDMPDNDDD